MNEARDLTGSHADQVQDLGLARSQSTGMAVDSYVKAFEALLAGSSLNTSAAKQLRHRASNHHLDAAAAAIAERIRERLGMSEPTEAGQSVRDTVVRASIARVYDAFLDGMDNYEIDRRVMKDVLRFAPEAKQLAKAQRRWLVRVIRYLTLAGVDQFLDCGSGMPTAENTHQIAQRHNPDAVVVYVDIDPVVCTHGRALLVENDRTHFAQADVTLPKALLAHPTVTKYLDFTRPIGMIQSAIMHHIEDEDQPAALIAEYIDALPPDSFVAFSHFWDPEDDDAASAMAHRFEATFRASSIGTGRFRTRAEIEAMIAGLDLLEPGLVELDQWRPDDPVPSAASLAQRLILGAVGRKP